MPSDRQEAALNDLEDATREWIDKEKKRIKNEVDYLGSVLEGMTGSSTLTRKNAETAEIFLRDELSSLTRE